MCDVQDLELSTRHYIIHYCIDYLFIIYPFLKRNSILNSMMQEYWMFLVACLVMSSASF